MYCAENYDLATLLVMEQCDGDVFDLLDQYGGSEEFALEVLFDVMKAVEEMRHVDIVHRDIKTENMLQCRDGRFKLADFTFAAQISEGIRLHDRHPVGSQGYRAPESIWNFLYSPVRM